MSIEIQPSGQACGATITGVDLASELSASEVAEIRAAWLEHHVVAFPNQAMTDEDLERFTLCFGPFGHDPFFGSIPGHDHIAAILREADETTPLFAENWHTDWSFQEKPPQATCLLAITIPPVGGDTHFADQHKALEAMPATLRSRLEGKMAIHSARLPYAPDGAYGDKDQASGRSMDIRPSEEALAEFSHPLLREHPETGQVGIFGTLGYIIGIEGMEPDESMPLLVELAQWQSREEFQYVHRWEPEMLVMWDNRSVLHRASGGFDGHKRLLHRTTVGAA
jgi:taurine dioxygenase